MSDTMTEEPEFNADIFDSMVNGTFEEKAEEPNSVEDEVDDTEDLNEDDSEDQEDTDQEDELDGDEDLNEDDDGDLDEDSEVTDEDEEEDSLVEDYDSDDEDDDAESEEIDNEELLDDESETDVDSTADEDIDEESEDDAETEEQSDGDAKDTDGIDYKAFYDSVVNTEFTVNGKKVKGFSDPKKIIQSQQMAGGFSEKMAGFKQYRPYMAPLKDRGMLDDPAKFDLAMNLIDGDKEAIKQHLKSLDIDPMDLDMDEIAYTGKAATASPDVLVIEDTLERAKAAGIEDRVRNVIGNEWDPESFQEFVNNEAVRNDLLNHIETGAYDAVQDKMLELSRLDYNGSYGSMSTINKYRTAVQELQKEQANSTSAVQQSKPKPKGKSSSQNIKAEKAKILEARKEEAYKEKVAKREASITQRRKKAASMSKKKPKAKPKKVFDPMDLEGDDVLNHLDFLISGGRG